MGVSIKEDISCYASEAQREVLSTIIGLRLIAENFFITAELPGVLRISEEEGGSVR